ncbi:MAG: hypothetical protein SVY41_02195 [Candidatus Nanohaloarchaea archaeon]|nr:hypothetical protein [Candidatus Nanohaloarchaea archaeon]
MMNGKNNPSIAAATRELLQRKPFLRELMDMDAVNYRGLARHFREAVEKRTGHETVNLDSIVMAIRRYEQDTPIGEPLMERIKDVLTDSELTMRSDIVYYTFPRETRYHEAAVEAYTEVEQRSAERAYLLQSDAEIAVVLDEKNADVLENRIEAGDAKNIERGLAMIVLDSPEEALEADGIISYLTERIIASGIGLIDLMTTYTEFVFLVREEDSTSLYELLQNLTRDSGPRERV